MKKIRIGVWVKDKLVWEKEGTEEEAKEIEKNIEVMISEDDRHWDYIKSYKFSSGERVRDMKYLIIEHGEYSDYGVSFFEVPDNFPLSEKEICFLISLDAWDKPYISGHIEGNLTLNDNAAIDLHNIKEEAESHINRLFCCYKNRKNKTVLDHKYTKEECLKIAMENDNSGLAFWSKEINDKYTEYEKAYELYQKIK